MYKKLPKWLDSTATSSHITRVQACSSYVTHLAQSLPTISGKSTILTWPYLCCTRPGGINRIIQVFRSRSQGPWHRHTRPDISLLRQIWSRYKAMLASIPDFDLDQLSTKKWEIQRCKQTNISKCRPCPSPGNGTKFLMELSNHFRTLEWKQDTYPTHII